MATCKDCVHCEACKSQLSKSHWYGDCTDDCKHFKDKSKFIERPCEIGDIVWVVTNFEGDGSSNNTIIECQITDIVLIESGKVFLYSCKGLYEYKGRFGAQFTSELIGEHIFLSLREAEEKVSGDDN